MLFLLSFNIFEIYIMFFKVFRVNWPEPVVVLGDPDVLKQG